MKLYVFALHVFLSSVCIGGVVADDTNKLPNENVKKLRRRKTTEEGHVTSHLFSQQESHETSHLLMSELHHQKHTQGVVSRRVIIKYKSGYKANLMDTMVVTERNIRHAGPGIQGIPDMHINYDFDELDSFVVTADPEVVEALQNSPEVESIEEDPIRFPLSTNKKGHFPSKEHRHLQERIPDGVILVQAPDAWARGYTGNGVKVCVIDSGIDSNHPDFVSTKLSGKNTGVNWGEDGCGHGTHVAGTIAGERNNGQGVVGVAPDAEIFTVRVFGNNCNYVYSSEIYNAARICKENNANIVSMSLGGPASSNAERNAFNSLYNDGLLLIAAAGNDGNTRLSYPASYDSVMSVAAVDSNKNHAGFSQQNSQVDIAAPGVDVRSTFPQNGCTICGPHRDGYGISDGTSMATPHVSGVAALLWQSKPTATAAELREALQNSAEDLGTSGRDIWYGHGLVQAASALDYLEGDSTTPSPPPPNRCQDFPSGWYDSDGPSYTCVWYSLGTNCAQFGDGFENSGYTANEACCACGGGKTDENPSPPPPPPPRTPSPTTLAPITPSPTSAPPTPSPTTAPPTPAPTENDDDPSTCYDFPGWYDYDGPEYDCNFYALDAHCAFYGNSFANFGATANVACCACGGGTTTSEPPVPPVPRPPEECTDVPGWYDSDGADFDCAFYAEEGNCATFGYGFENFGYTANEACCVCGGGI